MNALTWADIFRRHLLASQRHRRRARDAFPAPYVPKPPKWKHPDRAAADLAIAAAAAKIAARKKAEAERRAQKKREEERRRAAAAEDEEARKLAADRGAAAIREAYAREQAAARDAPRPAVEEAQAPRVTGQILKSCQCGKQWPPGKMYCQPGCGAPLTERARIEAALAEDEDSDDGDGDDSGYCE